MNLRIVQAFAPVLFLSTLFASAQQAPPAPTPPPAPLLNPRALNELRESLRKMKIPTIDTRNLIDENALHTLMDQASSLENDTTLLALQNGNFAIDSGILHVGPGNRIAPPGLWWKNPELVQKLALTPDQTRRMDEIVLGNRIQLIHIKANLEEQELLLDPMLNSNPPDQTKTLAQISRIADTRADLEKANARMLLGIRSILTPAQWTALQTQEGTPRPPFAPPIIRRHSRSAPPAPPASPTPPPSPSTPPPPASPSGA